mmetsp:Transcript_36044/g.61477  ORF Transcript_36044/g.61477 Transcript_36044/m.61477 type:complete len:400 (-) Transcript_36044:177-1376(-)|eukprot:CAMPEP_0183735094 /NCGR_PEP_ID=MMETSP0737-20130205/45668_1 /TAXON_ID=385413 /ORGANISM="Thalassiosira miniscula, Strain CCMP1093" /LENGTH=399 /DNA_ID=CAMNT_0025968747 /DNA_START=211 /DNA_END=1410 /DNA_ORIENTATION=-
MVAVAGLALFQVALLASWLTVSPVAAFAGIQTYQRKLPAAIRSGRSIHLQQYRNENGAGEEEDDPLLGDQREGMADAFSALDSLTADDFDDLRPLSPLANQGAEIVTDEMQAELSTKGEQGMYYDILGDLSGNNPEDVTALGQALNEAVDGDADSSLLNDADGFGATEDPSATLTTADVSNDILTQEIKPSLSMDEFMSSAILEAVEEIDTANDMASASPGSGRTEDIAKTAEQLLENEELRREIEAIFDNAGEKLRLEVEAMKREQEAVTQDASKRGLEYLESEKQRISEAEASVTRLIQKVAKETDEVQKAMVDLELAKSQAGGEGGSGSIEDTAIDLKKGGLIKQASLVGLLLFGSRAFTETILVLGSPYGDEHFVPAILQAVIALACAAYFFLVK